MRRVSFAFLVALGAGQVHAATIQNLSHEPLSVDVKSAGSFYPYSIAPGERVALPGYVKIRYAGQVIELEDNSVFTIRQNGFYGVEPRPSNDLED
ncbi:MAG: hypothetical protein DI582_06110 [Azospirillum brasilense]|nr:MAG: hypothetical protein DI582_06110 [Azospirillum brasilense]